MHRTASVTSICPSAGRKHPDVQSPARTPQNNRNSPQLQLEAMQKPYVTQKMHAGMLVSICDLTNVSATMTPLEADLKYENVAESGVVTTPAIAQKQTPKALKSVTIMEPTTHTFDPLLPTKMAILNSHSSQEALSVINNVHEVNTAAESDKDDSKNCVLDRITYDLNYLLNGSNDVDIPTPLPPQTTLEVEKL